ncbi:SRPBCC domain-containing protein [Gymnodinialimonas hymeniacidonis]|uniref:SRPBCC domain-containing protein n=1 Tax=Gymnodinialimonas hymeniacidonis TaxID=3126508 RepID=UPI0034C64BBC
MQKPLNVKREGVDTLIVTRDFAAPRVHVWQAFTDATHLKHWLLGPNGWQMRHCHVDARRGGSYEWSWRNPETGDVLGIKGVYQQVKPLRVMVDTQSFHLGDGGGEMGDQTRNAVKFEDVLDGGTRVTTRIVYPDAATRELVLMQDMPSGMEASYSRLDQFLAMLRQSTAAE